MPIEPFVLPNQVNPQLLALNAQTAQPGWIPHDLRLPPLPPPADIAGALMGGLKTGANIGENIGQNIFNRPLAEAQRAAGIEAAAADIGQSKVKEQTSAEQLRQQLPKTATESQVAGAEAETGQAGVKKYQSGAALDTLRKMNDAGLLPYNTTITPQGEQTSPIPVTTFGLNTGLSVLPQQQPSLLNYSNPSQPGYSPGGSGAPAAAPNADIIPFPRPGVNPDWNRSQGQSGANNPPQSLSAAPIIPTSPVAVDAAENIQSPPTGPFKPSDVKDWFAKTVDSRAKYARAEIDPSTGKPTGRTEIGFDPKTNMMPQMVHPEYMMANLGGWAPDESPAISSNPVIAGGLPGSATSPAALLAQGKMDPQTLLANSSSPLSAANVKGALPNYILPKATPTPQHLPTYGMGPQAGQNAQSQQALPFTSTHQQEPDSATPWPKPVASVQDDLSVPGSVKFLVDPKTDPGKNDYPIMIKGRDGNSYPAYWDAKAGLDSTGRPVVTNGSLFTAKGDAYWQQRYYGDGQQYSYHNTIGEDQQKAINDLIIKHGLVTNGGIQNMNPHQVESAYMQAVSQENTHDNPDLNKELSERDEAMRSGAQLQNMIHDMLSTPSDPGGIKAKGTVNQAIANAIDKYGPNFPDSWVDALKKAHPTNPMLPQVAAQYADFAMQLRHMQSSRAIQPGIPPGEIQSVSSQLGNLGDKTFSGEDGYGGKLQQLLAQQGLYQLQRIHGAIGDPGQPGQQGERVDPKYIQSATAASFGGRGSIGGPSNPVTPHSQKELDAYPKDTYYIGPNGTTYIK